MLKNQKSHQAIRQLSFVCVLLLSLGFALQASAIPFISFGAKAGMGPSFASGMGAALKSAEINSTAFGVATRLDLPIIQVELNVLYQTTSMSYQDTNSEFNFIGVPIIARFDISPVPLLKLSLGGGYEYRTLLNPEKDQNAQLNYLPISVSADFKIPLIATVGVELRYSHQLTGIDTNYEDGRLHDFMIFGHLFF